MHKIIIQLTNLSGFWYSSMTMVNDAHFDESMEISLLNDQVLIINQQ